MRSAKENLIDLIDDVTTLMVYTLAQRLELVETSGASGAGLRTQQQRIEALRSKMADAKLKLTKLKHAAKRKEELDKSNRQRKRGDRFSRSRRVTLGRV